MSGKTLRELALLITANSAEFTKKTAEVSSKAKKMDQDVSKSSKGAKKSVEDLSKGASGKLSELGGSLGALGPGGEAAAGGIQKISVAAKALNVALGPVGLILAAVAIAVKALTSYFKGSVDGAQKLAGIMGTLKGILAVIQDAFISLGRFIVSAFENPREAIQKLVDSIKQNLINRFQGMLDFFKSAFEALKAGFQGLTLIVAGVFNKEKRAEAQEYFDKMKEEIVKSGEAAVKMSTGLDVEDVINRGSAALEKFRATAETLRQIEKDKVDLYLAETAAIYKIADLRAEIKKSNLIAEDTEQNIYDRQKAAARTLELVNQLEAEKVKIAREAYNLKVQENAASESSKEDLREQAELYAKIKEAEEAANEMATTYNNKINIINNEIRKMEDSWKNITIETGESTINLEKMADDLQKAAEAELDALLADTDLNQTIEITPILAADNDFLSQAENFSLRMYEIGQEVQENWVNVGAQIAEAFSGAMEGLAGTLLQGGEDVKDYAKNLKQATKDVIGQFIAQGVAALVMNAMKTAGKLGPIGLALAPVLAAAAGGLAKSLFNSLIPKFGTGGYVDSPTLALVGEKGPEYIIPENKMKTMGGGAINLNISGRLVGSGRDLYAVIDTYQTIQNIG